ncbi:MAG: DUF2442 domain-containing protein [Elusimicrobiota bacterium]
MRSSAPGRSTSNAEVQNISQNGTWLLVQGTEYFLPHADYPWFKEAKLAAIYNLKLLHGTHLHWPDLDVDLELESLQRPDRYPLVYKRPQTCVADASTSARTAKKIRKTHK